MATATDTNAKSEPAPARREIPLWLLLFGMAGAPLAWIVQQIVNASFAGIDCAGVVGAPHGVGARIALLAVEAAAAAVAVAAILVSVHCWRSVSGEHAGRGDVFEVAEGRTRFMAMCGILTGVGFLVGIIFAALVAGGVTQCAG